MSLVIETSEHGSAAFSHDRKYRYRLTRWWAEGGTKVLWVMANPSTATAKIDDTTIRQCIVFSKKLGASSLMVVNLFAYRATHPKELLKVADPVGSENRRILAEAMQGVDTAVAAWGALSNDLWRLVRLNIGLVKQMNGLKCLGKTKNGAPKHPSRLAHATAFEAWP